jgi:hypothetical protein
MSWLDKFFTAISNVLSGGTPIIQRPAINFTGDGVTVADDPMTKVTNVTIAAAPAATAINAKVASTSDITLSGTQTIDGVFCGVGDVVLVTGQSSAPENGLWVVALGVWTRTTDTIVSGMIVFVQLGNANRGQWVLVTTGTIVVDTSALQFIRVQVVARLEQFGGGPDAVDNFAPFISALLSFGKNAGVIELGPYVYPFQTKICTAVGTYAGVNFPGGINNFTLSGSGRVEVGNPNIAGTGTVLRATGSQADLIQLSSRGVHIEDLTLDGNFQTTDAVVAWDYLNPQTANCSFERCNITRTYQAPKLASVANASTNVFDTSGTGAHSLAAHDLIYWSLETGLNMFGGFIANTVYEVKSVPTSTTLTLYDPGASGSLSAVTQVGTGPTVTIGGAPSRASGVVLTISLGGARGTAQFTYSINGGASKGPLTIPTTGSLYIPGTNVLATFAAGTYVLATTYAWSVTWATLDVTSIGDATQYIHKYTGAALVRVGATPTLEVDNSYMKMCELVQDYADNKNWADRALYLYGDNAFQLRFEHIIAYQFIDGLYVQNAGAEMRTCEFFGQPAFSRATITRDNARYEQPPFACAPMLFDNFYVETDAVPLIRCLNSAEGTAGEADPWVITECDFNAERAAIYWDCTQPLVILNTKIGGPPTITAVGPYFMSVSDCTLNNEISSFDFAGDLQRLRRRNVYSKAAAAMLPDILGAGTYDIQICDASQAASTRTNITDGVGTRLSLIPANTDAPQHALIGGSLYVDHAGADNPDYLLFTSSSVVEMLTNAYIDPATGNAKYSRSGAFAHLIQWDLGSGEARYYSAPSGTAGNDVAFTQRFAIGTTGTKTGVAHGASNLVVKDDWTAQAATNSATVTPATPSVQTYSISGLTTTKQSIIPMINSGSDPGTGITWCARISAADTIEFRFETSLVSTTLNSLVWDLYIRDYA